MSYAGRPISAKKFPQTVSNKLPSPLTSNKIRRKEYGTTKAGRMVGGVHSVFAFTKKGRPLLALFGLYARSLGRFALRIWQTLWHHSDNSNRADCPNPIVAQKFPFFGNFSLWQDARHSERRKMWLFTNLFSSANTALKTWYLNRKIATSL